MDRVRLVISYNSRWEQLPDGSQRFVVSDNQGLYVSRNMTYEELVSIVQTVVKYDVNKYIADLQYISIVPGTTFRTFIRNDDDVLFMLGEDIVIPQVCVSLIERVAGGVIGEEIPPDDNTQHFRSSDGSNQLFTERSGIDGRENLCGVPPEVADHGDIVGAQLNDDFDCQIELNAGQYNHQYNEMYDDMNNERNKLPHNLPIHEVANEANLHPIHNVPNNEEDEERFETKRRARRLHRCSSTVVDIAGTFEVRPDVTPADSENARTWVISGAESYSFVLSANTLVRWRRFIAANRQVSAVIIGEMVAPRLQQQNGRLMRPRDIIADMKTMYGIQIMYIRGFQRCMRPVIAVDGTHLKGRFGGIMFVTTAQDENEQVYPIDFGHFYENINKRYHRKDVAAIMDKAARVYTELQYNRHMEELHNLHPNAYEYVIDTGPHKWFRVHCPDRRAAQSMLHQLTDAAHLVILKHVEKCNFMTVNPVDWNILSVKQARK
ncbi:hypothetical protein Ddye_024441 [Dipteronia dyeriana]|uniref:Uncharacterized protein n=1 Tax=Dipteronia dyeriana TaxID=168575 RepID=A0AAD9WU66_9ROSI|nr:hypothetical protein Ddye_024441 [Dipteronia dyeriana]